MCVPYSNFHEAHMGPHELCYQGGYDACNDDGIQQFGENVMMATLSTLQVVKW